MAKGIITKGMGGGYHVKTTEGAFTCQARGRFRKDEIKPMVGDYVELSGDGERINEILPRKNSLVRPPVANIDRLVLIVAAIHPAPDLQILDKLLVNSEYHAISAAVVVNKVDLSAPDDIVEIYTKAGYPVLAVSAETGEGMDELSDFIGDGVNAFAGASGVGKSSVLNRLDNALLLETGGVSRIGRGRHTTRHVELIELESGGLVLDTPGFSTMELPSLHARELKRLFPEFRPHEGNCRFCDCAHNNERDCAVLEAVRRNEIAHSRHENYQIFYNTLKQIKEWQI